MSQIKKKFIEDKAIDESKILLLNDGAVKARNAANSADVSLFKLDADDKLQLLVMPEVSADASSANQLVRKSQVDAEISAVSGSVTSLEGRVEDLEDALGQPDGIATLDENGLVPTSQLPSYVDDVLEFASLSAFPVTGQTGKIYIALDTNKTYRWGGSVYVQITSGAVDSVNGQTGIVVLDSEDVAESGDSRYYTAARQTAIEGYADQAEADAISAANGYTDAKIAALVLPESQRKQVNYVSGSDVTGNGSALKPWQTVSYACSQITDSATIDTTATWASGSTVLTVPSTTGLVAGQVITHASGSSIGFATGTAVVTQVLSATTIQISVTTTAARATAFALSFTKSYCIEFDGIGLNDVVSLPPNVSIVGRNVKTSQIGTINATYTGASTSVVSNAEITSYNADSSASASSSTTRFFDCRITANLGAAGGATSGANILLFDTDVVTQLHMKGGTLYLIGATFVSRLRLFHNTLSATGATQAIVYGGQQGSAAGTWLSGNSSVIFIGSSPIATPFVGWGESSANVFSGRVFSFTASSSTWNTDVTISIQSAATQVVLTGDGVKTISTLISDWNAANPSNLMALVEGNGAQVVPSGAEIVFLSGYKPSVSFDSVSYPTEAAGLQGTVSALPLARPEGIKYDDRARASYAGFRFYAESYGAAGNSIALSFFRNVQTGTTVTTSITRSGVHTLSSNVITGLSTTADLFSGMKLTGSRIAAGTRIASVLSASSIQLTANVAAAGTGNITFTSPDVVKDVSSVAGLAVGMSIFGSTIPANATISAIYGTSVVLSANAASNATGATITFGYSVDKVVSNWNTANPSNKVTYTSAGDANSRGYGVIPATATVTLSGGGLFTGASSTFSLRDAVAQLGEKARDLASVDVTMQGLIDALEAASVEFVQQKFVLTSGDIAAGYIDLSQLAISASVNAFVDRLAIHETDDYTLSTVAGVTRMTFAGSLIGGGEEQLAAGDVIRVKYAKRAIA